METKSAFSNDFSNKIVVAIIILNYVQFSQIQSAHSKRHTAETKTSRVADKLERRFFSFPPDADTRGHLYRGKNSHSTTGTRSDRVPGKTRGGLGKDG